MNQVAEFIKACLVGLVQGLTEFLPVSSSGHMVIIQAFLGIDEKGISVEILSHLATSLVVIIFLRRRIWEMIRSLYFYFRRQGNIGSDSNLRMILLLIFGSIPAGIVGISLKTRIESLFESPRTSCLMLILTGCFLLATLPAKPRRASIGVVDALLIGLAQAVAIIPGISRSGLTIGTALLLGIERREAFEFSVLLSLPAILGAGLIDALAGATYSRAAVIAALFAFFFGYLGLRWLRRMVIRAHFHYFSLYLIPIGILTAIMLG